MTGATTIVIYATTAKAHRRDVVPATARPNVGLTESITMPGHTLMKSEVMVSVTAIDARTNV